MIVSLLLMVAAIFYAVAAGGLQWNLLRQQRNSPPWTRLVWVGFCVHSLALSLLWARLGAPPVLRLKELIASVSWLVIGLYAMLGRRWKVEALGTVAAPAAAVCAGFSAFTLFNDQETALRGRWVMVHVASLMTSYAAFCLAALCACLYFLQSRYLKAKRLRGALLLPSLDSLDRASLRFILAGVPLLILGIISGTLISGWRWSWDIKQNLLGVACGLYLIYLHARAVSGWRGRWINLLSLSAFLCLLLTSLAPSQFHQN